MRPELRAAADAPRAVVLLSGGLDSTTCLAMARAEGRACYALTFRYGQRHEAELLAAREVATHLEALEHRVVEIDLGQFGASALTSDQIEVPKDREAGVEGIPVTYVPARNTVFLSLALALAEVCDAREIWIGVNAVDYSGYPDCRPEFIRAFEAMAGLATKAGIEGRGPKLRTPLLDLSKSEIIKRGIALGVDYAWTSTCYDPGQDGRPCMRCDACVLRARGFAEAGLVDPRAR